MTATTVRVDPSVRDRLASLAAQHGRSITQEIAALVDQAEEEAWREQLRSSWARLRSDPEAWADYLAESDEWDATSGDGLSHDEWPEYQAGSSK